MKSSKPKRYQQLAANQAGSALQAGVDLMCEIEDPDPDALIFAYNKAKKILKALRQRQEAQS